MIIIVVSLIFLELYKGKFFLNDFQLEQVLRRGFILFYLLILAFFIFKGFGWAKWVLSLSCFVFVFLLIPPAVFQIIGQLENPSPIYLKVGTFIMTIGLSATLYMVMGFAIIKSRSISAFIDSQRMKNKSNTGLGSK